MHRKLVTLAALAALMLRGGTAMALPVDDSQKEPQAKQQKPPDPKPGEIPTLITQLGAADWQAREKAMRSLIRLGDGARSALRTAMASADPEVRWRATYALSLLDINLEPTGLEAARVRYAAAAQARAQRDTAEAEQGYADVVARFPKTRWASAARERLAAIAAEKKRAAQKPPPEAAVAQLIAQLASASWPERQEASRRLAALGEAVRPALQAAAQDPDAEAAWRARRLLERLDAARLPVKAKAAAGDEAKLFAEVLGAAAQGHQPVTNATDTAGLVRALAANEGGSIARAREALIALGQKAIAPLLDALETCDETTGVEIMDILREITRESLGFDPDRWQAWWRQTQERGKD